MKLLNLDHAAIAVRDLDEAINGYRERYFVEPLYRETVESQGVDEAMIPVGGSFVQLIQPLSDETPVGRFLSKNGEGLHHVAYAVLDIDAALDVLNLSATQPEEFVCSRQPLEAHGHSLSVDSPYFRIEHVDLAAGEAFAHRGRQAHCLHGLSGSVACEGAGGVVELRAGGSAFVPFAMEEYRCIAGPLGVQLIRVLLP